MIKNRFVCAMAQVSDAKQAEQARTDAAQQVAARVEIVSQATPILGRVDSSMSDSAIMRAVVVKVRPGLEAKLDAHAESPGYLRACFDDALEAHARNAENSAVIGLAAAHAATASERGDSLDDLRDAYIASMGRK